MRSRPSWTCLLTVIVVVSALGLTTTAAAQVDGAVSERHAGLGVGSGSAHMSGRGVEAGLTWDEEGEPDLVIEVKVRGATSLARRGSTGEQGQWELRPLEPQMSGGFLDPGIVPALVTACPGYQDGWSAWEQWYAPPGGQAGFNGWACTAPGADGAPTAPPPPPPPPPSLEEIRRAIPFPRPGIGLNPEGEGLTGLDHWLWYEGDTAVSASVSIRGYSVSAEANATRFTWIMGDGATYSSGVPGSEARPAATHMYETKDDYTVSLRTTWTGSYTFSGYGIEESGSLGGATVTASRPYHVVEIRAVRR